MQTAAYYPYGEPWLEPEGSNRRLFTGKERLTDLSISLSDYGARLMNHRTIGWTTQDPCAEDFRWLSPYSVCGSDPINYVDLDGCRFTEESLSGVCRMLTSAFMGISLGAEEFHNEYRDAVHELLSMITSPQLFHISSEGPISNNTNIGGTIYDLEKDAVVFMIPGGCYGILGLIAHEFKHGYQFLIGEMDLGVKGLPSRKHLFYDITDEEAAFERGKLFGADFFSKTEIAAKYSYLLKERMNYSDIRNYNENLTPEAFQASIQNLSNIFNRALRIKNITYRPKKL